MHVGVSGQTVMFSLFLFVSFFVTLMAVDGFGK